MLTELTDWSNTLAILRIIYTEGDLLYFPHNIGVPGKADSNYANNVFKSRNLPDYTYLEPFRTMHKCVL